MSTPTLLRVGAFCAAGGVLFLLAGQLVASVGAFSGFPEDPDDLIRFNTEHDGTIETGWLVLHPIGVLLVLGLVAVLATVTSGAASRFMTVCGTTFAALSVAAGVVTSTTASTLGFYDDATDSEAAIAYHLSSIGFHLGSLGTPLLAAGMVAGSIALHGAGLVGSRMRNTLVALAVLMGIAGLFGTPLHVVFGLVLALALARASSAAATSARTGRPEASFAS